MEEPAHFVNDGPTSSGTTSLKTQGRTRHHSDARQKPMATEPRRAGFPNGRIP